MNIHDEHATLRAARCLLRRVKIGHDKQFAGELRRLRSTTRIRKTFFSARRGRSVDQIGELLWDAGIIPKRPSTNVTLHLIETIIESRPTPRHTYEDDLVELLSDGDWMTLKEIYRALHLSPGVDISRRLRALRARPEGLQKRRGRFGEWEYAIRRVATKVMS